MNNLYDIVEICLQDVENGLELEKILARYPEHAEELRPILQASINARQMAVPAPSSDVVRRNRAKLLQHAAQMRETQPVSTNRWFPAFQRLAVVLAMLVLFFVSGAGLVRASASALPGDGLYSVKRSWEDVTLFFTFDATVRQQLMIEFENERLAEISELAASGRSVRVDFSGTVTRQNGDGWWVSNILVIVSEQTDLPDQAVNMDAAVRVTGTTNGDGIVYAEKIELLPADAALPEVTDAGPEIEAEQPQTTPQPTPVDVDNANDNHENDLSVSETVTVSPDVKITTTPTPAVSPQVMSFEGILNSISKDVWTVNAIFVHPENAEIKGTPVVGARVKVTGYQQSDGSFIAIKLEIINTGSGNDNPNSSNQNSGDDNTNDNANDDDGNNNGNDNSGKDDNNNNGG